MPDLAQITLHVRPTHQDDIPAWTGRAAHAWFLKTLQSINPILSETLHDASGHKPLTISALQPVPQTELFHLHPRQSLTLRITTLHADLTNITLNGLVPIWQRDGASIHDQPLRVESVDIHTADYADLLAQRSNGRTITFNFRSPTLFKRTGDIQIPLPLPEYVFGNLLDRWQMFSSIPLDLRDFINQHIVIQQHHIHTRQIAFARGRRGYMTGFLGEVTFRATITEQPYLSQWHSLARFALFSGVGAKTSFGLGWVE